ncbi:MAG: penicillin-binding protein activator LpoB [Prevotellaceae bacterium]|jgi:hypothetical protein|nr:penicillin-binding protein activator LpoB [Prevotellaceae bacterium]
MIKVNFFKKGLLVGVICGVALTSFAQEAKTADELKAKIGIIPFNGTVNGQVSYYGYGRETTKNSTVQFIQDEVEKSFVKTGRFIVLDRGQMSELKQEKERQKSEDFMDSESDLVQQGKNLGADYLIGGNVDITPSTSGSVNLLYFSVPTKTKEKVTAILKIIKVETGEIIKAVTIKATRDKIEEEIDKFVEENFAYSAPVADVQNKEVLVAGVFQKDDILTVSEVTVLEVQGKKMKREKEIGTLKVISREGEFCTCTIKSGDKEIQTKFAEKANLQVSVKSKK